MKQKIVLILLLASLLIGCGTVKDDGENINPDTDINNSTEESAKENETEKESEKDSNEEVKTYKRITMAEAVEIMAKEQGYIILDVRRIDEYAAGHIPGAINIPNETIGTKEIPELPSKDQLILVYCRSGNRSKQASEKLVNLGYTNIVEFGGIIDWPGSIEQ